MTDNTANQQPAPAPAAAPAPAPAPQAAGQPATPPPGVKIVDISAVFNQFHARISALEAAAKTDVSKVRAFLTKYWPIGAGIAVAATRFIPL